MNLFETSLPDTLYPKAARKLPRDINTEIVTKIVPVRAVDLSIGPFCTEFRCERFCDDAVFGIGVNFWSTSDKAPTTILAIFLQALFVILTTMVQEPVLGESDFVDFGFGFGYNQ